jgi:hypothetical protein
MTALAKQDSREVARPLKVLEKLIKEAIESANKAGMAYYKAAGELLNEARDGHFEDDPQGFYQWAKETFDILRTQTATWMGLAAASSTKSFKSLKDFRRRHQKYPDHPTGPGTRIFRDWTSPVDDIAERARDEARRLAAQEELTRQQERDAEAKLGLRLISIGFKVLARELHPDKGGSREAMARLNRVRDRLKANV